MEKKLLNLSKIFLENSKSDAVGIGVIDFKTNDFLCFQLSDKGELLKDDKCDIYFDYASLTKPLINGFSFISENIQNKNLELLINHRAGIPAWGILQKKLWREQIMNFPIQESSTLYSDYSALRYMLEFEKLTNKSLEDIYLTNLDKKILFWKNLSGQRLLQYGFYNNKPNIGRVHDPNASNLDCFTNHAGLFGTIDGFCKTLLDFSNKYNLLERFSSKPSQRFHFGFDTVENPGNTLAGIGCGEHTFGHLGFTGTSFWIDPEKKKGHIVLSNATKYHWYDKKALNILRRSIGEEVWLS